MDSVFVEQLKRSRYLVALLLVLNVLVLALSASAGAATSLLVLTGLSLLVTLILFGFLRNRSMNRAVAHTHEPLLAIDPNTGIATEHWYRHMLALECRRAVREFSPLTVMRISLGDKVKREHLLQVVRVLSEELSRPGDLIGWDGEQELGAVLPATNEHAGALVQRCYDRILEQTSIGEDRLWIVAQTFQPRGSLNLSRVAECLNACMQEQSMPGVFHEAEHATTPDDNMTYNAG